MQVTNFLIHHADSQNGDRSCLTRFTPKGSSRRSETATLAESSQARFGIRWREALSYPSPENLNPSAADTGEVGGEPIEQVVRTVIIDDAGSGSVSVEDRHELVRVSAQNDQLFAA